MKLAPLVLFHLFVALAQAFQIPARNYDEKQYFVVEIDTLASNQPLRLFIEDYAGNYLFEHPVRGLDNHYVFSLPKDHDDTRFLGNFKLDNRSLIKREGFEEQHDKLVQMPGLRLIHMLTPKKLERRMPVPIERDETEVVKRLDIVDSSQEPLREVSERLGINDPNFIEQWHLVNTQFPGNDVNVKDLWYDGVRGKGVTVAVIDDGLDYELADLHDNFNEKGLWDFNDNTNLPKPRLFDDYHGTRCAGEIAAVKNDVCGVGVAYEAKVAGIRILSGAITTDQEAAAMIYGLEENDIYSCSWGPTDNGRTLAAPHVLVKKAMIKGVQEGRSNKGALYVFASGNGGRNGDQCNFDGYTNSIYSITVGAIDYKGFHPSYAEACSAVMVVTYSSGSGEHIHTTDIHGKCSGTHGGTSAAAPLAAGIYALVLQANPELTWRDVQYVSAKAAVPVHEDDGDYQLTGLGEKYSQKYGFGKLDAKKLVETAREWKNVKPQAWLYLDVIKVDQKVSGSLTAESDPIKSTISITKEVMQSVNLERIEHVTVKVNIASTRRGKIGVRLVSPSGMVSTLARYRPMDQTNESLRDWFFMSVAHFGENGLGDWTLEVKSDSQNEVNFIDWQLRFFGESIDADKAEVYDITKDYAAERREKAPVPETSTTVSSVTPEPTLEAISEVETSQEAEPSSEALPETLSEAISSATPTSGTSGPTDGVEDDVDNDGDHEGANKHYTTDHAGQYFMALAVVGFLAVIIMMKWHKTPGGSRRRRRDEYEFDIIPGEDYSDSDEDDSLDLGHPDSRADRERERLYDEFNAETLPDYEDEMFQIGDEDEAKDVRVVAEGALESTDTTESAEAVGTEENGAGPDAK